MTPGWRHGMAAGLILSAAGCGGSAAIETDPAYVIVGIRASPSHLDPRLGVDESSQRLSQLVYSPLMALGDDLRVVPHLAVRLDNPDPLTYIAHLRSGVRFHDGHELTAADVVYTFGSLLHPESVSPRKDAYRMVETVRAVDDWTVEFTLKEPYGSFPSRLVMPIVPAGTGDDLRTFPIGTGPYRFVRHAVDDRVVLSTFEGYWDGLPQNAGIVLKIIPDATARELELRAGTVDLIVNDVSPDAVHALQRDGLQLTQAPGVDATTIVLNMRDPVLADRRVRHAIAYAVDRPGIVADLRRGFGTPAIGMLAPMAWAFEPSVRTFERDLAKARTLLEEAGYRTGPGEVSAARLRVTLATSDDELCRRQASMLRQNLREVGIDLAVRVHESTTLEANVALGRFQMATMQWVGVTDPDILRRAFHSEQVPPLGLNRGRYSNPEVDRLIELAGAAATDGERRNYYGAAQRLIAEDTPHVSLWHGTNVAVAQRGVTGLQLGPQADMRSLKDVRKPGPGNARFTS